MQREIGGEVASSQRTRHGVSPMRGLWNPRHVEIAMYRRVTMRHVDVRQLRKISEKEKRKMKKCRHKCNFDGPRNNA
jgi:hypothetical protein